MDNDVRDWFRRRTYRAAQFDPLHLAESKLRSGDRISVVLPALNEERRSARSSSASGAAWSRMSRWSTSWW